MNKYVKYSILILIALLPLVLYRFNFGNQLSHKASDWAAFGSYVGGVYGVMAFFAVAYSINRARIQFAIQHEEDVFYKSIESMQTIKDERSGVSFKKGFVSLFKLDLCKKSSLMTRNVLCNDPNIISFTNKSKIINAINSEIKSDKGHFSWDSLVIQINVRKSFDEKWEYLKSILGGIDGECAELKKALEDSGSASFYHATFKHRNHYYKLVWDIVEKQYSEEINLFIKKMDFLLFHLANAKRKVEYKKYLLSQFSKYDYAFFFCYALANSDQNFARELLNFGLLNEVERYECRSLLFDSPSAKKVIAEMDFIKKSINIYENKLAKENKYTL